ncbi:MAG: hypothetical protein R2755_00365 [Acidimicrobiales bacterium]
MRNEIAVAPVEAAQALADRAAATLPCFASRAARDPQAPQNLTPVGGLSHGCATASASRPCSIASCATRPPDLGAGGSGRRVDGGSTAVARRAEAAAGPRRRP